MSDKAKEEAERKRLEEEAARKDITNPCNWVDPNNWVDPINMIINPLNPFNPFF
jgi:hypothetical protein